MDWIVNHTAKHACLKESVLRLRGLPFEADENDILEFFCGECYNLEIKYVY